MTRTFLHNNRLTLAIAFIALVVLPLLAALVASGEPRPSSPTAIREIGVTYPVNFRQNFTRFATVQRPDGTIRDLYMNAVGLSSIQYYYNLPYGTVIVVDGYNALKNADGSYVTDANGHYVKGEALTSVHVREKHVDWSSADFTSSARNEGWNFGSFDTQTGAKYNESLNACFLCHNTAPADFTYSGEQMTYFARTGESMYFMCRTTGRTACE